MYNRETKDKGDTIEENLSIKINSEHLSKIKRFCKRKDRTRRWIVERMINKIAITKNRTLKNRVSKRDRIFTVRIDKELKDRFYQFSKREGRSYKTQIELMIENCMGGI